MQKRDADRLCALTEMLWISRSQRFRKKLAYEKVLVAKLEEISSIRELAHQRLAETEHPDPGVVRATSSWMRWSEREQKTLNIELAKSRAALSAERAETRRALGRHEAAKKVKLQVKNARRRSGEGWDP